MATKTRKKAPAKKVLAKKAPAKKVLAKKSPAKKSPAKRGAGKRFAMVRGAIFPCRFEDASCSHQRTAQCLEVAFGDVRVHFFVDDDRDEGLLVTESLLREWGIATTSMGFVA